MPAALAIPAIISAGASVGSAVIGSKASKKAGDIQSQAADDVSTSVLNTGKTAAGDLISAGDEAATGVIEAGKTAAGGITSAAADAQTGLNTATEGANELLGNVYTDAKEATSPYTEAGELGIKSLSDLAGEKFTFSADDPSYQFRLTEGMKALERSAAARGGLNSGGALKKLTRYSQDVASTEYQAAFDRFIREREGRASTLAALAGFGQNAVGQRISAGQNYGNQASGNLMDAAKVGGDWKVGAATDAGRITFGAAEDAGNFKTSAAKGSGDILMTAEDISGQAKTGGANAKAAGTVGAANAWAGGAGGAATAAKDYYQAKQFRDLIKKL